MNNEKMLRVKKSSREYKNIRIYKKINNKNIKNKKKYLKLRDKIYTEKTSSRTWYKKWITKVCIKHSK